MSASTSALLLARMEKLRQQIRNGMKKPEHKDEAEDQLLAVLDEWMACTQELEDAKKAGQAASNAKKKEVRLLRPEELSAWLESAVAEKGLDKAFMSKVSAGLAVRHAC